MCNFLKNWRLAQLLVCLMLVALAPLAQANMLPPGTTVSPDTFGTIIGTTLATNSGTISAPSFTATFTTSVIADPANVFCAGCLDYVYQFTNNGPDVNGRYSMGFFSNAAIQIKLDVGIGPGSRLQKIPFSVDRNGGSGGVVGFNYLDLNQVGPGETTVPLVIETNTRQFTSGFLSAQDATSGNGVGFAPTFIPEPSSLFLLGGGLLAIGSFVRRSRVR